MYRLADKMSLGDTFLALSTLVCASRDTSDSTRWRCAALWRAAGEIFAKELSPGGFCREFRSAPPTAPVYHETHFLVGHRDPEHPQKLGFEEALGIPKGENDFSGLRGHFLEGGTVLFAAGGTGGSGKCLQGTWGSDVT